MDQFDFIAEFKAFIKDHDIEPPEEIELDGNTYNFCTHPAKPWKRGGFYRVYWDERPTAFFGDHRTGLYKVFVPQSMPKLTTAEREAMEKEIERQKRKREKERRERQRDASLKCLNIWNGPGVVKAQGMDHPYLMDKNVQAYFIRLHKKSNRLLIPIQDSEGNLRSIQSITAKGRKKFAPGAPLKGYYYSVGGKPNIDSRIFICEGYATGISIALATGDPTVMAFSSWNLEHVAKTMRRKYGPGIQIIIAGDNDCETPGNPGLTASRKAAKAVGGYICLPPPVEEGKAADWNDVWCVFKEERTKQMIEQAIQPPDAQSVTVEDLDGTAEQMKQAQAMVEEDPNAWRQMLLVDAKGAIKPVEANVAIILAHDPELQGLLAYNKFSGAIELRRQPPWPTSGHKYPAQLLDKDRASMLLYFQRRGIMVYRRQIDEAIKAVPEWSAFDPLEDMLNSLEWDGEKRIDTWMIDYCDAEDNAYTRAISRAFLIGAVARALDPGCKMDTTLTIEGDQGSGKSTLVKVLAMNPSFSSENFPNLVTDKYPDMQLRGVWIMEVPELSGISKADVNRIKEFLSRNEDRTRDPYATAVENRPRRCVFIATTNQAEYLRDPTGARRFWPIRCGRINLAGIKAEVAQMWAEAVHAFRAGESWHLSGEALMRAQREEAAERQIHDPLEQRIAGYIRENKLDVVSPSEIMWDLVAGRDRTRMAMLQRADAVRVSDCLLSLGWVRGPRSRWCKDEIGVRVDLWLRRDDWDELCRQKKKDGMGRPTANDLIGKVFNLRYYNLPTEFQRQFELTQETENGGFHEQQH